MLKLRRDHGLTSDMVDRIEVTSFHEAIRLATARPGSTEEAQYSTSFPCAVALVRGGITPQDLDGDSLQDPEITRLSAGLTMTEDAACNAVFPAQRHAYVTLHLRDGRRLHSGQMQPRWDHDAPPSEDELRAKYHALADPVLGPDRAARIEDALDRLDHQPLTTLTDLLFQPVN